MKRVVVIIALAGTTAACASASAPSSSPAPATDPVATVPAAVVAESTTTSIDLETGQVLRMISLPPPSGDPELDALGAEIAGLEEELAALDAAALDLEGTP